MKQKKFIYILLAAFIILGACSKENEIVLEPFEYSAQQIDTTTILGKKIYEINEKYESKIIYNWDAHFIGNDAKATPPYYEKVYDFILFLEEVWFKPYYNDEFLRNNLPREIVLVGGSINYGEDNGSNFGAAGQAESQYRIAIGLVNNFRPDFDLYSYFTFRFNMELVLHHEFSHILHKRYDIPEEFLAISKGLYLNNTHHSSLGLEEALNRGFIRPYGASNENEDFATMVETITTRSEETILYKYFLTVNEAGDGYDAFGITQFEKVYKKYKIIIDFYNDLGIDVQRIGNESEAFYYETMEALESENTEKSGLILNKELIK